MEISAPFPVAEATTAEDHERHLALLLEAQKIGRIGSWERDLRTNQLWWSDQCYRLFGYEPGGVQPSYPLFLQHVHPDDRERVAAVIARSLACSEPHEVEYRALTRDGEIRHFVHRGRSFFDRDGTLLRTSGTTQDITDRKEIEINFRRQHAYLKAVLDNMPLGISVFDESLRLRVWNQSFIDVLGLPCEALHDGATFSELAETPAAGGLGAAACIAQAMSAQGRQPTLHTVHTRPDGVIIDIRGAPLADGSVVTVYTDITAHKRSQERLLLADKVFAHSPAGIVIADERQRVLSINPALASMLGLQPGEVIGRAISSLPDIAAGEQWPQLLEALHSRGAWSGEMEVRRRHNDSFTAGISVSRVSDPQGGQTTHYIWMFADVTERKRAEERVRHMAQTDPLTGLPNRLALLVRLSQILPEARRHGWKVAVMFIDLDRFKIINDTLGHQVGDDLLREVARRLAHTVRESDTVARLGGDEFVIVLPDISSATDAAIVAGKIITALSSPISVESQDLHTSPSIGISLFPTDGSDADTILKNADTAMYHAKAAGRNNYQFYADEMNRAATERLDLESKLRHAIARGELSLVFQPQFDAASRRATGVEALLRWHHPVDGVISPVRFIPIAEETGLIVAIGEWVLHAACSEVRAWIDAGLPPLRVAVNVSARQLRRRDFCETVAGALARSGLPPELLELEITESAVMENPQEAILILEVLRRMGVLLAIDDFGTGYSSLAYLKLFPIDHLKIDRSFVADIEHDLNDRAIALGSIALARSLGLKVIAEGVETEDQLELLRTNGCDEVQGYLLSTPLAGEAACAFLLGHCKPG